MPSMKCHMCRTIFDYADEEIGSTITCVCGAQVRLTPPEVKRRLWPRLFSGLYAAIIIGGLAIWLLTRAWTLPPALPPAVPLASSSPPTPRISILPPASIESQEAITVGGKILKVVPPKGFARVKADEANKRFLNEAEAFVPNTNRLCAVYIDEREMGRLLNGESPNVAREMFVEVSKQIEAATLTKADFGGICSDFRATMARICDTFERDHPGFLDQVAGHLQETAGLDVALKVADVIPLPPHEESADSLSYSMYMKYSVKLGDGQPKTSVRVGTTVLLFVQDKVLFFYIYGTKDDLEWTRATAKDWSSQVLGANPH